METQPKPATPKDSPTLKGLGKQVGKSGTLIFRGIISGEEYNSNLSGKQSLRKYDIMRKSDSTVHSMLIVVKLPIQSAMWDIEPASEDEGDQYAARFVKRELFERNINFPNMLREGLNCLDFGYSVAEKVYEMTEYEGKVRIGLNKVAYRKQTTIYSWETPDGKPGITQMTIDDIVGIPEAKLIVFTNDQEGDNKEGVSVLRYVYKDWDMKDKLGLVNAIALEKQAVGIPVIEVPADADPAQLALAEESVKEMRANESAFVRAPAGYKVEMMDMKANTTKEVIPSIQYHDRQIVRAILAQFLELGASEGSGSRALSEDHSRLFVLSLEAVAKQMQSALQQQLVNQLCDLNFSELPNGYPKLTVSKISDDNVLTLADSLQKLATAGLITANADTENYIRGIMKLPELPEDETEAIDDSETETAEEEMKEAKDALPPEEKKADPKAQAALKRMQANRKILLDSLR